MAKSISRTKKVIILASAAAAIAVTGAGVALAYWTSTGTGDGTATTGTSTAFTITAEDAVGVLAPGSDGQTVDFTVTNPGPATQRLSSVVVTLADAEGVAWVPTGDCDIADYTATISVAPVYGSIAAGDSLTGTATVVLANTAEDQDDCQGQTVPLHFVAA